MAQIPPPAPRPIGWEVDEEAVEREAVDGKGRKSKRKEVVRRCQLDELGREAGEWKELDPKRVKRVRLVWSPPAGREPPSPRPAAPAGVSGKVVELDVATGEVYINGAKSDFRCHPNAGELGIVKSLRSDVGLLQFSECVARVQVGARDIAINPTSALVAQAIGTQVRRPDGRLERRYVRVRADTGEIEFREEVI
jgi:hypothetical protein